jgi:hypothetical protein
MTPEAINAIAELGAERARVQKVAAKAVLDANDLRRSLSDAQGEVRSLKADLVFVKAERDALKERLDIERAERTMPSDWDGSEIPFGECDEDAPDRTVGEWIELGAGGGSSRG